MIHHYMWAERGQVQVCAVPTPSAESSSHYVGKSTQMIILSFLSWKWNVCGGGDENFCLSQWFLKRKNISNNWNLFTMQISQAY